MRILGDNFAAADRGSAVGSENGEREGPQAQPPLKHFPNLASCATSLSYLHTRNSSDIIASILNSHDRTRTSAQETNRSDAIEKLPAAIVYGPKTRLASMKLTCLNRHDNILQLNLAWLKGPEAYSANASTLASQSSAQDVKSMKSKIRRLEEQLSKACPTSIPSPISTPKSVIETTTSDIGGIFHVHRESGLLGQPLGITRNVTHKTRLFGQSHWINAFALFQDIIEMMKPHLQEETASLFSSLQRCKSLARTIKSGRAPPWPMPLTIDLPSKDVSDELVECYLRTTETVYRILHIPTFRRDYEKLWVSDITPNMDFLVQLKVVLAIGAITYDEEFSLRAAATRWVYEAQTWLSEPKFKSRLNIQYLQTELLLLLARETAAVSGDPMWISAGSLLRRAIFMGLHRDPSNLPKRTPFAAEMHRRLWNTILEVALQSSLTLGGPPLVCLDDFDTEPPGNFDDDEIMAEDLIPKTEDNFTQMSVAIALRKTFPLRLAVTRFLNNLGSHGTYEETLRLDAGLRASYKSLCRSLQVCNSSTGLSPSGFQLQVMDFIMHRYMSALHIPFFGPALHETSYAFSRKVVVENSVKIWCAVYPSTSIMAVQSCNDTASPGRNDLARLAACGSGFYRNVAVQATLLIAIELRTQIQEDESLGPVRLRSDLLSILDESKTWSLQCIEAGEVNMKGYLFMCVLAAHIEGLIRGIGKDDIPALLIKAAEEASEKCLPILEKMAAGGSVDDPHQMSLNAPPGGMEDWDFMMSSAPFNQAKMRKIASRVSPPPSFYITIMPLIRTPLAERNSNGHRGPKLSKFERGRIIRIYNTGKKNAEIH
ncbi:hypothetical protein G7Y89_g4495 [Cudoniella acicularis]|uniref:Xylanolytic transcriptional activator regulatory domain-containing protein n=1 Tax=Cudoniella acicularis TaxID=354080 RepID=A0A8H4RRC7_9HELO|nr:hypothetical protein G7Y89_g4495 [Cudoniella acicularis]